MKNFSHCPHCNPKSFAYVGLLEEFKNFYITCDVHPLTSGHILIIPKSHFSCIGNLPDLIFKDFLGLYKKVFKFVLKFYGSCSVFEHGIFGQTIFHSHVHFLPFSGTISQLVPEGNNFYKPIKDLSLLKNIFDEKNGYLFTEIKKNMFIIDDTLAYPGFFRYRYSKALNNPNRGNWREMRQNPELMKKATEEIKELTHLWKTNADTIY